MKKIKIFAPLLILFLFFLSYNFYSNDSKRISAQETHPSQINANGKYSQLLQKVHCPSDKNAYGEYSDYGYYEGGNWCNQQTKSGYWLYVYPYWYIYEKSTEPKNSSNFSKGKGDGIEKVYDIEAVIENDQSPLNRHNLKTFPSFFGQYSQLVEKFKCDHDPTTLKKKYSHWSDLQYRNNYKTKCENHHLKSGFVVYVRPYYYVWKKKIKSVDPMKIASAGGYYRKLIKTRFGIMADSLYGGRVYEEGYSDLTYSPGYGKMTPGFRVFFDGKWYTWSEVYIPKKEMKNEIREASNNGKYKNLLQIVYCPFYAEWSGRKYFSRYKFEQREIECGGYKVGNKLPHYKTYLVPYLYIWENYDD